jgi:hypothetical protein
MQRVTALALLIAIISAGCGFIADKDRIVVGRIGDNVIRRGDLFNVLRAMPDEERPNIVNKGDLVQVLQTHIDDELKLGLGQRMAAEGKVDVPRERAEEAYFATHPELISVRQVTDPSALGMTTEQLAAMQEEVEMGIDRVQDKLLGESAVFALAKDYLEAGVIEVSEEDLNQEYSLRKNELLSFETVDFVGLRFPTTMPNAEFEAANARRLVDEGAPWDQVLAQYYNANPDLVFRSKIENNPAATKFRGFWTTAAGAKKGDVLGPVFIPAYSLVATTPEGGQETQSMPDAYLVFEVINHKPEALKTIEEAKADLLPSILYRKALKALRDEKRAEIYEDKLPDPSLFMEESDALF